MAISKNPVVDELKTRIAFQDETPPRAAEPVERINQIIEMQGNIPTPEQILALPLEKQLGALQTRELLLKMVQEEMRKAEDRNFRIAGIKSWKQKIAEDEARQRRCAHLKENGSTALAGQRGMDGKINLICQFCMLLFTGTEIPPHLMPKASEIGGFSGTGNN